MCSMISLSNSIVALATGVYDRVQMNSSHDFVECEN